MTDIAASKSQRARSLPTEAPPRVESRSKIPAAAGQRNISEPMYMNITSERQVGLLQCCTCRLLLALGVETKYILVNIQACR